MQPIENQKKAIVSSVPTQRNNQTALKVREAVWYAATFGIGAASPMATMQICTETATSSGAGVVGHVVAAFEFYVCHGVTWPYLFCGVYAATRPWITLQDFTNNTWTGRAVQEVKNFAKAMVLWTVGTVAAIAIMELQDDLDEHRREDLQAETMGITVLGITMLSVAFCALYMSCARRR